MSRRRSHYRCPSCGEKLVIYSLNRRVTGEEIHSEVSLMCEEIQGKHRCDFLITLNLPTKGGKIAWPSRAEFTEISRQFSQQFYVLSIKDTTGGLIEIDFEGPFVNEIRASLHCRELIVGFPEIYCWEEDESVDERGEYPDKIRLGIVFTSDVPDQPFFHFCRRYKGLPEIYAGSFFPHLIRDKRLRQIFYNAPVMEIPVRKED